MPTKAWHNSHLSQAITGSALVCFALVMVLWLVVSYQAPRLAPAVAGSDQKVTTMPSESSD
jgi:hypothetical protein